PPAPANNANSFMFPLVRFNHLIRISLYRGNHVFYQLFRRAQETRGAGANLRHVRHILPETEPAESLLVVESVTPAGNWSSYPPHRHDTDDGEQQTYLEETYYHRVSPPQGFAIQRVYTDDRSLDETLAAYDKHVVLVPRGYHPVAAAHGYDLYYLNVMAGPRRTWHVHNEPAHEWLLQPGASVATDGAR
ncbi:5-deoxy-glucuronate isomerase, partial [Burkholderia multivorans]|uniref:5-deoxy-glucuronate isomerase n=1 Tax=Burkholderia multivorans TaxID=87883 RepID=UPI001FC89484